MNKKKLVSIAKHPLNRTFLQSQDSKQHNRKAFKAKFFYCHFVTWHIAWVCLYHLNFFSIIFVLFSKHNRQAADDIKNLDDLGTT